MDPNTGHIFEFEVPESLRDLKQTAFQPENFSHLGPGSFDLEGFNQATDSIKALLAALPDCRAKSLALTKLDECVLWTTQAMGNRAQRRGQTP